MIKWAQSWKRQLFALAFVSPSAVVKSKGGSPRLIGTRLVFFFFFIIALPATTASAK